MVNFVLKLIWTFHLNQVAVGIACVLTHRSKDFLAPRSPCKILILFQNHHSFSIEESLKSHHVSIEESSFVNKTNITEIPEVERHQSVDIPSFLVVFSRFNRF